MNKTINLTVPRTYAEMTAKQLRYLAALQLHGFSESQIWQKCLIKFSGIKPIGGNGKKYHFAKKHLKGLFSLTLEEMNYFTKKMDFLTRHYIGIQPVKIGKYKPCEELLRDTCFIQYLDAENHYQAFLFTKDEQYLFKLMGTLYQIGKQYNNNLTDSLAKYFARKATEEEKLIVTMWMIGIKEFFTNQWTHLFEIVGAEEDIVTTAPDMLGIIQNQIRMLTQGDITKREQVLNSNTWTALDELNSKVKEGKAQTTD